MSDDKLHGYPANSVGGQAIQRGRDAFDNGEPCPQGWPYLARRGWYDRKAEAIADRVIAAIDNAGPDTPMVTLDSFPTTALTQGYNQGPTPWPEPHAIAIDKEGKATKVTYKQAMEDLFGDDDSPPPTGKST